MYELWPHITPKTNRFRFTGNDIRLCAHARIKGDWDVFVNGGSFEKYPFLSFVLGLI